VPIEYFSHQSDASLHWHVRESHQPRMRNISYVHQFTEVGINRYQDSSIGSSVFEQGAITGS
jgi:hypothetical protein